jgi:pimeloyl-ACP methyl ester carboxylesterase
MHIQKYFSLVTIFFTFCCYSIDDREKFYSTAFLKDRLAVRESLKKTGFQEIIFKTSDNISLSGLFLLRPHATCNVIVCAGWLPGTKEGMATFYALLPEYCNILFFDARGHGQSKGPFLWNLWRYGIDEYKDILGAISYINRINELPIVITGICSGAFNAAHALIDLEKNNIQVQSNVKGLIFDSGWGSVTEITRTAPFAGLEKRLVALLKYMYHTKHDLKQSIFYKLCSYCTQNFCKISYHLCAKPLVNRYEKITNLFDKIHRITVPIFFIHSYDDTYAAKNDVLHLAQHTLHKKCWWLEQSYHAKHHLLHKDLYKQKLSDFITAVIK